jgi:hypothetical protein
MLEIAKNPDKNVYMERRILMPDLTSANSGVEGVCMICKNTQPISQFYKMRPDPGDGASLHHPMCLDCCGARRAKLDKVIPAALRATLQRRASSSLCRAASRGLLCLIYAEDAMELWLSQKGKCALTGRQMTYGKPGDPDQVSIDRKNSADHYTIDNIHLVCSRVNLMKLDMSIQAFREWCGYVAHPTLAN